MDNWKHTAPPKYNHPFNKRLSDTDYGLSSNKFLFLTFRKIGYYCPLKNPCLAHLPLLTQCQFPYYLFQGFPGGSAVENLPAHVGNTSSIPGLGRSPGEENGNQLQYYCPGITWTEESGKLQSMGSQRVGHNLMTKQQHPFYLNPDF